MKLNVKFTAVIIGTLILPLAILTTILFYNMEQNVIDENLSYMERTSERNDVQIENNVDSINMSTQFFLTDDELRDVLISAVKGETMTTEEILFFYENDVADLERLVNSNPVLYSVRVFSVSDNVQEMMPVFYRKNRMDKLAWSHSENVSGWQFCHKDTIFPSLVTEHSKELVSLVTPIKEYGYGTIGYVEASMEMETMFPSLYEQIENEWSCFVRDDGTVLYGTNKQEDSELLMEQLKSLSTPENKTKDTLYVPLKDKKLIVSYQTVREMGGILVMVQDISAEIHGVTTTRNLYLFAMAAIMLLVTALVSTIVKHMLRQFYVIMDGIRKIQAGDLDVRIEERGNDEMGELSIQLNKMLDRIRDLMQENLSRELLVKNSEIRVLQNQISAHFIYNVLESIKMMAEIDEEYEISDAITSLGKLLRYSMKGVARNVVLRDELEYIKNYMVLINLRFDYDIYLSTNIPEELLDQEIPKMSLQPIVENAIMHGIEQMAEDTNIYIKGIIEDDICLIQVTDAGVGMQEEEVEALRQKIKGDMEVSGGNGHGIGLKNVQDRITMAFGAGYGLEIDSMLGCYTKVTMRLPRKNKKPD